MVEQMTQNQTNARPASGTLGVVLLQLYPSERWAVVRWQAGPMMYRTLERYGSEADAYTGLGECMALALLEQAA